MKYELNVVQSKCGQDTLKINDFFVHSKFNPLEEAERLAERNFKSHNICVVFGYGLGYVVDALLERVNSEHIIIIDPLIEEGQLILQPRHRKLENVVYWDHKSVNTLAFVIKKNASGLDLKINVICGTNYDKLFTQQYYDILKIIKDFQISTSIHKNTTIFFAEKWQKNMICNLKSISKDASLSVLQNRWKLPIVVCSGGPSLTKQLPLLKKIEHHVLIIAAGSTINSLIKAGIVPDFVVSIDGGEPNYNHFKNLKLNQTRLIYSIFNHPGIRKSFSKKAYVFTAMQQESIQKYLKDHMDILPPMILGGGTVAHFTYSIAHLLNTGPITFIGQDLAYTNNQTHADNNKNNKTIDEVKKLNNDLVETEGYYGEKVLTSKVFLSMKQTFEEFMRFHEPIVPVFNSTEGGVKIQGMNQIDFLEFIERYVSTEVIKDLSDLDEMEQNEHSRNDLVTILKNEINNLNKLKRMLEDALLTLKMNNSRTYFEKRTLKKLDKIEKEIEILSKEVLIYFLIEPIIIEITSCFLEKEGETAEEAYQRVFKQSETLYKRMLKAINLSKNYIIEELEKEYISNE
ncbi:MAG: 6-hydroxymethylpterin diphosphokinase MptE-like protein [Caryophanon sp.]|nr:6-hydroxymethylpterin diphosphokinase MptE-like protein [Caryophanon sp.]